MVNIHIFNKISKICPRSRPQRGQIGYNFHKCGYSYTQLSSYIYLNIIGRFYEIAIGKEYII